MFRGPMPKTFAPRRSSDESTVNSPIPASRTRKPLRAVSASKRKSDRELAKLRAEVIEATQGFCEGPSYVIALDQMLMDCQTRGSELHHKLPRARGGKHTRENVVWICSSCHKWAHSFDALATEIGLLVSSHPHDAVGPSSFERTS